MFFRRLIVFVVVLGSGNVLPAQDGIRPIVERGALTTERLLSRPDVQLDLRLSKQQVARLASLFADLAVELQKLRMAESRAISEKLIAASNQSEAEATAILTKVQRQRLKQILLQARQGSALADPQVQKELGFTPQQSDQVQAIERNSVAQMMADPSMQEPRSDDGERFLEQARFRREQVENQVLAVLTSSQRTKFEALLGPRFQGDLDSSVSYISARRNDGNSIPVLDEGDRHRIAQHPYLLLVRDDVLADLALSDQQRASLLALVEHPEYRFSLPFCPGSLPPARGAGASGLTPLPAVGLGKLLSDQQRTRVQEIRIQLLGERMLLDPDIQGALRLSRAQVKAIAEIHRSWEARSRIALRRTDSEEVSQYVLDKLHRDMRSALRNVLTPEEQSRFATLGGRKFEANSARISRQTTTKWL